MQKDHVSLEDEDTRSDDLDISYVSDGKSPDHGAESIVSSGLDGHLHVIPEELGQRIAFDEGEESDAAYTAFKERKGKKRKAAAATTRRVKAKLAKSSLVGRKPRTVISIRDGESGAVEESDNDETTLTQRTLPDYLAERRNSWMERQKTLKERGLLLPPEYDDLYFSGDDRLEALKERPDLPCSMKQRAYKDVELPYSGGTIPAALAQWLREYQIRGAEFLHELFVYQKGGILGDDMGLGKTIQVIAFLTAAFGKTGDERDDKRMRKMRRLGDRRWYPRVLIIAPGTLMANWRSEFERWGWWQVYTYHGLVATKEAALAAAETGRLEIMITTYHSYRLNESAINGIRWDCVIADECHIIKEKDAEITKSMNNINALCRIGLTGTAIQNKYEELWTLLNWTNPGRLGPLNNWKQMICIPLKLGQSHEATVAQLSKGRRTAEKLVRHLLPQFFLRRTKQLIAHQLPKKSDQVIFCPMTETQALAYSNLCDSEIVQTIYNASEPCTCSSGKKQGWCCYAKIDGQKWQTQVFPCLVTLQKLANHVALLVPSIGSDKDRHDKDMEKLKSAMPDTWRDLYRERDSIMNYANTEFCGKWRILQKLLRLWYDGGDKVLIFSFSVKLLKMLHMLFKAKTVYNVSFLDGGMSYEDRQRAVDDYNSDPAQFVFLISTKAGGTGLNITAANKVVIMDPNWNPAYDLQAQDRAYRIGQTRDVEVFRLVSVGTVEEIVYARQIYKQQQANIGYNASVERRYFKGVQDQKEMKGEIFGLSNLFAPLSENIKLRDIVNKTNIAETRAGVEISALDLKASQTDGDGVDQSIDDTTADSAMSQLAADIINGPDKKHRLDSHQAKTKDPVQAILASAGVEYTHENAEVIGTSRIETKLSSRAQQAGTDYELSTLHAFSRSQHEPSTKVVPQADHEFTARLPGQPCYRYRPPTDVRKRQFCTMAKQLGYDDVTEFALVVEGWTQAQRRDCLEKFYLDRTAMINESGFEPG